MPLHQKLAEKHGLGYEPDRSNDEVDENGKRHDENGLELPEEGALTMVLIMAIATP